MADPLNSVVKISWRLEKRSEQDQLNIAMCPTSSSECPEIIFKVLPGEDGKLPFYTTITIYDLNSTAEEYVIQMSATSHGLTGPESKPSTFSLCEFVSETKRLKQCTFCVISRSNMWISLIKDIKK